MCHSFFAKLLLRLLFGYLLYAQSSICQINVKVKRDVITHLYPNTSHDDIFFIQDGQYTGKNLPGQISTNNTIWFNLTLYGHTPDYNIYLYSQNWETNYADLLVIDTYDNSLQGRVPYSYNENDLAFKLSCSQFNSKVVNATLNLYIMEYPSGTLQFSLQISIPVYCTKPNTNEMQPPAILFYFLIVCGVLLASLILLVCCLLYLLIKICIVRLEKGKKSQKNKARSSKKVPIKYDQLEVDGMAHPTELPTIDSHRKIVATNDIIAKFPILARKLIKEEHIKNTEPLREGNFSYLAKGYINNGNYVTPVLIKTCSTEISSLLVNEFISIVTDLSCVTHQNFLSLEAFCLDSNNIPIFAYPLPNLGILKLFLKNIRLILNNDPGARVMNLEDILFIGQQIAKAMNYIVTKNLVHKDLASRNVYMHEGLLAKIGDPAFSYDLYSNEYYQLDPDLEPIAVKWQPIEVSV